MPERKVFNKSDLLLIVMILTIAIILYFVYIALNGQTAQVAQISLEGKLVKTVELTKDSVFSIEERPQVEFEVQNNAIRFKHSDCQDQICVNTGYLKTNGHLAACLPNGLALKVFGEYSEDEPDIIAQ